MGAGGRRDGDRLADFGAPADELLAARDAAVLCELSPIALLSIDGADAQSFLHSQLASDVRALAVGASQLTALCTPKGRMVANFLLWCRAEESFVALVPASLASALQRRLSMYVLRARVRLADASAEWARMGVGGPGAREAVGRAWGDAPPEHASELRPEGAVIAFPGGRFVVLVAQRDAPGAWRALAAAARPAGFAAWQWLDVASGVAWVVAQTSDAFVPQAANWELLGGVSFQKGCYPGQEIVARTQYLGRLKERLARLSLGAPELPEPGTRILSPLYGDQAAGLVAAAAPSPGGGSELLAVVQITALQDGRLALERADGPSLEVLPMPYAVPLSGRGQPLPR